MEGGVRKFSCHPSGTLLNAIVLIEISRKLTGVGTGDLLFHRGTRTRAVCCIRTLISRPLEEVMLQRVIRRDSSLRVVVKHAKNQVLEFEVIGQGVSGLSFSPTPRTACLDTQYVVKFP